MIKILAVIILVLFSTSAIGEEITDWDRFDLFHNCKPVGLGIGLSKKDTTIDISEEDIGIAVRSRLRSAGLYNEQELEAPNLFVTVYILESASYIEFALIQILGNPITNERGAAVTWSNDTILTNADDSYILQKVSQGTDRFIDEYLRVNVESC